MRGNERARTAHTNDRSGAICPGTAPGQIAPGLSRATVGRVNHRNFRRFWAFVARAAGQAAPWLLAFAALELRAALAARLLDDELDAPVLAPAGLVVLLADRLRLAVAVAL